MYVLEHVITNDDLEKFKDELNKTFDLEFNMTVNELEELIKENGVKTTDCYTIASDDYNSISFMKKGKFISRKSGWSGGYSFGSVDLENGVPQWLQIEANNTLCKKER